MLSHNYDYRSVLATSERVGWKLDDVIGARTFDFTLPFLPESLAGLNAIECLAPKERLVLNHIRGFTYLYLFGLVEKFIVPFNIEHAHTAAPGDAHELRAVLRFTEEETKHIEMFERALAELERGLEAPCQTIGPASAVVPAILAHSRLGVAITTLCLEWMSQRHYVDSIRHAADLDPLFTRLLEHHWIEEAQHTKVDTLIIDQLARSLRPDEIEAAIDDFIAITKMLDGAFAQQIAFDLECLSAALGRSFTDIDKQEIVARQVAAYRRTFLLSGMTHPAFDKALRELSSAGHARVVELGKALS